MPKKILWRDRAKAELRAIEQGTAIRILHGLARAIVTGEFVVATRTKRVLSAARLAVSQPDQRDDQKK